MRTIKFEVVYQKKDIEHTDHLFVLEKSVHKIVVLERFDTYPDAEKAALNKYETPEDLWIQKVFVNEG